MELSANQITNTFLLLWGGLIISAIILAILRWSDWDKDE